MAARLASPGDQLLSAGTSQGGIAAMDYTHQVLVKGNYQVVAFTADPQYDPADITAYAVLNLAGDRLRQDLSLEQARFWLDTLVEKEALVEEEALRQQQSRRRAAPMQRRR
jgi:hypothetical protein